MCDQGKRGTAEERSEVQGRLDGKETREKGVSKELKEKKVRRGQREKQLTVHTLEGHDRRRAQRVGVV